MSAPAPPGAEPPPRFWPARRDPRWPFAALLTLYAVLGFSFLGFNRTPAQMAVVVGGACALDLLLTRLLRGRWLFPLSAYITGCSLALLLNYAHSSWVLLWPALLAIGSKHALTFQGRHVYNPSLFGVAVSLLASRELITAAPAYQWAGGAITMSAFLAMAALSLFVFQVRRGPLVVSFLAFYALQTALRAYLMRHHLPPETLFIGTVSSPPFFLFTFYMMTDPATSPRTARGQVALALALTLVDLYLHTKESVFTFFYAAFSLQTAKLLFLHAREAWTRRRLPRPAAAAWVGAAILAASVALVRLGGPRPRTPELSFRMEPVPAERSGLGVRMGDLLTQVDPRLQHVAKWVLSVGDAVAAGDWDGDGDLDLFLTHPLQSTDDRAALYRNDGELRFTRVPVSALARYAAGYREHGLPTAAAFIDHDGDGDQDLAVGFAFGPSRLFRNLLAESGRPELEEITDAAGWAGHTVSLAVTFLDFDRDGHLDALVTNSVAPYLRDYPSPTPLNAFRLPDPEFPGDRRMFRFMHDGWHDAANGGLNTLYRGKGDGTYQRLDAAAMGMPETHWTLAAGTADFNRDGWTDLYLASDFGPDDLYLNEGGRRFRRVAGRMFGEVGRDTYKGMNVSIADFDRNGWQDVYVSNVHHALQAEGSLLWMVRPSRDPFLPEFSDQATQRGALNERRFGWGAAAGDLDNDGWPDLLQANGMVDDRLDRRYERDQDYWYVNHKLMQSGPEIHTYADRWGDLRGRTIYPNEARRAYLNLGSRGQPGQFADVAEALGVADPDNSRGVLLADLDGDGDLDALVTNQHGAPSLYRNTLRSPDRAPEDAHFVGLTLSGNGVTTSRAALGTQVVLRYTEDGRPVEQVKELGLMGGFSGQADPRLHFGLGRHRGRVTATVRWYGGEPQTVELDPDRYHHLRQPPPTLARRSPWHPD